MTKTPFNDDNIGFTAPGSKVLTIEDGIFHFRINSYGSLVGKAFVSNAKEHIVALRFYKDQHKWEILVDGIQDCWNTTTNFINAPDPHNSELRLKAQVGDIKGWKGQL